ncbi:Aminoacyl tRNA synthase complex-interacting multifunctional protein 1 [Taenia crassiceps]|uniref:Aminoacyl tRNA synthase complex-interacting multifunctional protein 1 n=1 Tax=Taenia crassiceps TaxID=6207 RepID=A0ABR4QIV7_9CEST
MSSEKLAAIVRDKISVLANSDESAIKRAELVYAEGNAKLKREIQALKEKLVNLELLAGYIQYFPPLNNHAEFSGSAVPSSPARPSNKLDRDHSSLVAKSASPPKGGKKGNDLPVDVSRIDMRVGKIMEVERHPDADSLFVEKVNLGEGNLRTVVSGLVPHVPIERMQGLVGIFMCNLKPVKMRGIESQVIESPTELTLGDRVYVEGYPGEPDAQLNPKKKVWEQVKPDMRVDGARIATYKGVPWKLRNSPNAVIKASTVVDAQIS